MTSESDGCEYAAVKSGLLGLMMRATTASGKKKSIQQLVFLLVGALHK